MRLDMEKLARRAVPLLLLVSACAPTEPGRGSGSGKPLWTAPPDANWQPVVDDSTVYFKTNEHTIVAVRRSTGAQLWVAPTGAATGSIYGKNGVIAGGLVIFADYSLYAFDRATGAFWWKFEPRDVGVAGYAPGAYALTADDSIVFTGSGSGHAFAIRAATGEVVWTTSLAADSNSSAIDPVFDDSTVFVHVTHFTNPLTGELVALNRFTGAVRWRRSFVPTVPSASDVWSTAVSGDLIVASVKDGTVHGVDKATGADRWIAPRLANVSARDDERVIVSAGRLIVAGSSTSSVTAYDAMTGAVVWQTDADQGSSISPLTTDGNSVYVVYANGVLVALDLASGGARWVAKAPTGYFGFVPYPLATATAVYAPSASGLIALRP